MLPDSRSPRRLPIVMSAMTPMPTSTFQTSSCGTSEASWSSAEDVETATVMT